MKKKNSHTFLEKKSGLRRAIPSVYSEGIILLDMAHLMCTEKKISRNTRKRSS